MGIALVTLAIILTGQATDQPDLAGILESLYEPIADVSFEFEGTLYISNGSDAEGSNSPSATIGETFSGSFAYRTDGATKQETFHRQNVPRLKSGVAIVKKWRATIKGKTMSYEEQAGLGNASTDTERFVDYFRFGSAGRLFLVKYLTALARYPNKRAIHEGSIVVDGHSCEVFAFVLGKDYQKGISEASIVERFYLDLQRGGHPIKVEISHGSRIDARLLDINLESFQDKLGRAVWLPVSGRYEAGDELEKKKPQNTEILSVMRGSIRLNIGLSDDYFRLRLRDGTLIKDGVAGKVIRSGKDVSEPPVNLAESQEQLRRQIAESESQQKEVLATSLARGSGWNTLTWVPWTVALVMTAVVATMLIRQRIKA